MTINGKGELFGSPREVRVVSNPGGSPHPALNRPLEPGDVFTFADALNGRLYYMTASGGLMAIDADCVEVANPRPIDRMSAAVRAEMKEGSPR